MKISVLVIGTQLVATAFSVAVPAALNDLAAPVVEAREAPTVKPQPNPPKFQDIYNGSHCLKRKREAEGAALAAAEAYKRYAEAMAANSLVTRAPLGKGEDTYNGSQCLKLKREAEKLAAEARDAAAAYEAEMAKRGFVAVPA